VALGFAVHKDKHESRPAAAAAAADDRLLPHITAAVLPTRERSFRHPTHLSQQRVPWKHLPSLSSWCCHQTFLPRAAADIVSMQLAHNTSCSTTYLGQVMRQLH
jgi:hypothetical protein